MKIKRTTIETERLVLAAVLTAVVILLQVMAMVTKLFLGLSINLSLIPIVIGAAVGGVGLGAWLGFVSGIAVLITGEAGPFLALNIFGALLTVLLKGTLAGAVSAVVYKMFEKQKKKFSVYAAAMVCPIVNSSIFVIGCTIFFREIINEWGSAANVDNAFVYFIFVIVLINFTIELLFNVILSPYVLRLLEIKKKK